MHSSSIFNTSNKYTSKRNKDYGRNNQQNRTIDNIDSIMKNPEVNIRKTELKNMKRLANHHHTGYSPSAVQLGQGAINLQDGIKVINASLGDPSKLPTINTMMTPESLEKGNRVKIINTNGSLNTMSDFV